MVTVTTVTYYVQSSVVRIAFKKVMMMFLSSKYRRPRAVQNSKVKSQDQVSKASGGHGVQNYTTLTEESVVAPDLPNLPIGHTFCSIQVE